MARLDHYVFHSEWVVDAAPEAAYFVLEQIVDYPLWWPEVREVKALTDQVAQVRCRSLLPYDLVFTSRQEKADEAALILEARLEGDLEGFSRWTMSGSVTGSRLSFEEEVVTRKKILNRLAPVARPFFKANHALMMRNGEAGLQKFLAGYQLGYQNKQTAG